MSTFKERRDEKRAEAAEQQRVAEAPVVTLLIYPGKDKRRPVPSYEEDLNPFEKFLMDYKPPTPRQRRRSIPDPGQPGMTLATAFAQIDEEDDEYWNEMAEQAKAARVDIGPRFYCTSACIEFMEKEFAAKTAAIRLNRIGKPNTRKLDFFEMERDCKVIAPRERRAKGLAWPYPRYRVVRVKRTEIPDGMACHYCRKPFLEAVGDTPWANRERREKAAKDRKWLKERREKVLEARKAPAAVGKEARKAPRKAPKAPAGAVKEVGKATKAPSKATKAPRKGSMEARKAAREALRYGEQLAEELFEKYRKNPPKGNFKKIMEDAQLAREVHEREEAVRTIFPPRW